MLTLHPATKRCPPFNVATIARIDLRSLIGGLSHRPVRHPKPGRPETFRRLCSFIRAAYDRTPAATWVRSNLSVILRLFATIGLISLLSAFGAGLTGYYEARERIDEEMNAAMVVGRATAERSMAALAGSFRPEGHLTEFVSLFDGDRHLKAKLYGPGGLLAESKLLPPNRSVPAWFSSVLQPEHQLQRFPLPGPMGRVASLTLETDPNNEIEEVWGNFLLTTLTVLAFMTLTLTLVALVVWQALRPVKPLLAAFEKVGTPQGPSPIDPHGPPEFRQLHSGFNAMAARLEATERRNASLSAQIATVQEEERADLARDLHDEVGPQLFAIDVDASAIRSLTGKKPTGTAKEIAARASAITASAVTIKQQVRTILARLRPNLAADIGLEHALMELVAGEQERHPSVKFEEELSAGCDDPVASAALYAVAREAMHNALLHGQPSHVRLSLSPAAGAGVELAIENDGGGMKPARAGSHGLRNMRERVEALGGSFSIDELAAGVRVRASVPVLATRDNA